MGPQARCKGVSRVKYSNSVAWFYLQLVRVVTHPVEAAAFFGNNRSKCHVLVIARVKGSTERE